MSVVTDSFRQLVERRLWPLALLLLIALLAVPILLSKPAEPGIPGAVAGVPAGTTSALGTQPIVSVSEASSRAARRKVLGSKKNPFKPEVAAKKAEATAAEATPPTAVGKPGAGGGGTGGIIGIPPLVQPTTPVRTYELHSLTVRFGSSTEENLKARNLKRLTALPSVSEPVIIYLGLLRDNKTAVFLVDAGVTVQGDGRCKPSPTNCETIQMKPGETTFLDVEAAGLAEQFQLDFVRVKVKKTTDAKAAAAERALVAPGGREVLRARSSRAGGYRYDSRTGRVRWLSAAELKAVRAARAARSGD